MFTKTRRVVSSEETAKNAQLLIRAGFINKEMAGVYAYLPLGLKVIENLKTIIREEMRSVHAQEILMSTLQPKDPWEATGRWDDAVVDIWFKSKLQDKTEVGFGWSHEEPILKMSKQFIESYKDLPVYVYQFQNKLRNELRAKSGLMRGREFLMKDLYSMTTDAQAHQKYYDSVIEAYKRIFERVGIGQDTYFTFASGGAFTEFSHEFQTLCDVGEDEIYLSEEKKIAVNKEVYSDKTLASLGLNAGELKLVKSVEVGNIFNFGTAKSEQMDIAYTDESGAKRFVFLGSYGIGVSRLMGIIAEKFSDDKGLVWPEAIAPARIYLISLGESEAVLSRANQLYKDLTSQRVEVLYDERNVHAGEKFADADLMGVPYRLVISEKSLLQNKVELKSRSSNQVELLTSEELLKSF